MNVVKNNFFHISFIVLLSLLSCTGFLRNNAPETIVYPGTLYANSRGKLVLTLQPLNGIKIFINNKRSRYRVIKRDKSMGIILISGIKESKKDTIIRIQKKGYKPAKRKLILLKKRKVLKGQYVFLNKKRSSYKIYRYFATGRLPKSVRFLDNRFVVVPLLKGRGADLIDVHSGERRRISPPGKWAKYKGFVESEIIPATRELWISQMQGNRVHVFSLPDCRYKRTIKVKSPWGKVLCYDSKREKVYFSNWLGGNISIIDINNYKEISQIKVGGVPRGLLLSENKKYLYVAQYGRVTERDKKGQIVKVDLDKQRVVKRFEEGGAKRHIVYSGKKQVYYVSDMSRDKIYIYDNDDTLIKKIPVGSHPNTISLSANEDRLYVSCRGKNSSYGYLSKGPEMGKIYIIDTELYKIKEVLETGNQATGLAVSPNGKFIASTDFMDNALRVYVRQN